MGVNPPGETPESTHSLKQRYRQQKYQLDDLETQLKSVKANLNQLQVKFEEVSRQLKDRENELHIAKQQLKEANELNVEKENLITELNQKVETSRLFHLEEQNQKLKAQVEELKNKINREWISNEDTTKSKNIGISNALIKVMLSEFDPDNPRFEDAFVNFVETLITQGDTSTQIIAVLVKYGGYGPLLKLREIVNSPDFDDHLNTLLKKEFLVLKDQEVRIKSPSIPDIYDSELNDLKTDQLFDALIEIASNASKDELVESLDEIRDILQSREIPLSTIFFEIRKLKERVLKDRISLDNVKNQIMIWKSKYQSLS